MNHTPRHPFRAPGRSSAGLAPSATKPRREAPTIRSCVDTVRAAELLGMSKRTLEKWRVEGTGPPFLKLGRRVLYSTSDLEAWIESRRRRSTSEL